MTTIAQLFIIPTESTIAKLHNLIIKNAKTMKESYPILYHVCPEDTWPKNTPLYLLGFATINSKIAIAVNQWIETQVDQVEDNQWLTHELMRMLDEDGTNLGEFFLAKSAPVLVENIIERLKNNSDNYTCFHIIKTDKTPMQLKSNSTSQLDKRTTTGEITRTLVKCKTLLMPNVPNIDEINLTPIGQMALAKDIINTAVLYAEREDYNNATETLRTGLTLIKDTVAYTYLGKSAAKLLTTMGKTLTERARKNANGLMLELLRQSIKCYDLAILYYVELKLTESAAKCYVNLAVLFEATLKNCPAANVENNRIKVVECVKMALAYYERSTDTATQKLLKNLLIAHDTKPKINYTVRLSRARALLKKYHHQPATVSTQELKNCQESLEGIINASNTTDIATLQNCTHELIKVSYALAIRSSQTAEAYLYSTKALELLPLAGYGNDPRTQQLLLGINFHIRGNVLLKHDQESKMGIDCLKRAHAIFTKYHIQASIAAIERQFSHIAEIESPKTNSP
ncbi:MAG: hypothetical protein M3R00_10265, partial [Pseudomonadota bacterium]|nr:hypothetical protein [Pseudomonadota bacterium]